MVVVAMVWNFKWTEAEKEEESRTKVKFQFKGKI